MTDTRYRRHPDFRITDHEGEGVALHLGDLAAHARLTREGVPVLERNHDDLSRLRVIDTFGPGQMAP